MSPAEIRALAETAVAAAEAEAVTRQERTDAEVAYNRACDRFERARLAAEVAWEALMDARKEG